MGPTPPPGAARPILVVEDDSPVRRLLVWALTDEGYAVREAPDGAVALARAQEAPPGLILLDMRMPVLDGWGFASALRERGLALPVVVMTAAADAGRWADEIGAVGVVAKPFGVAELVSAVRRFGGATS